MLVSMKEMQEHARKNHYAISAFDISNYDRMKSVLVACEPGDGCRLQLVIQIVYMIEG